MSTPNQDVLALQQAFDAAFAHPHETPPPVGEALLVLQLGEDRFAMPLASLDGLVQPGVIVPLPGAPAALLGLAGVRGQLVPVFDLAAVLGRAREAEPSWLVLVGRVAPIALAFRTLEGHLSTGARVPRPLAAAVAPPGVHALLRGAGAPIALLDVAAVAALASRLIPAPHPISGGPA